MLATFAIEPAPLAIAALQFAKRRPWRDRRPIRLSGRPVGVVLQGASFAAHVGESDGRRRSGNRAPRDGAEMSALHPIAAATFADRRDRYGPGGAAVHSINSRLMRCNKNTGPFVVNCVTDPHF